MDDRVVQCEQRIITTSPIVGLRSQAGNFDFAGVSSLTNLTTLYLNGTGFTGNMSGISSLTSLTFLYLIGTGFTFTYTTFLIKLNILTLRLKTGELSNPSDIDGMVNDIDSVKVSGSGTLDFRSLGAASPTGASSAARASLVTKGSTLLFN